MDAEAFPGTSYPVLPTPGQVLAEVERHIQAEIEGEAVQAITSALKVAALAPVLVGVRVLRTLPPPEALWK